MPGLGSPTKKGHMPNNTDTEDAAEVTCISCHNTIEDGDGSVQCDGEQYCTECADRELFTCDRCSELHPVGDDDDVITHRDTQRWCAGCAELHAITCDYCDRLVADSASTTVTHSDGRSAPYCPGCRDENTFTCEGCCEILIDELYHGDGFCNACRQEQEGELLSFSAKPPLALVGNGPIHFGLEIEVKPKGGCRVATAVEEANEAIGHRAICKSDGSVSGGFEICTSPMDLATHRQYWEEVLKYGVSVNAWRHEDCGTHVHISRDKMHRSTLPKLHRILTNPQNESFLNRAFGRTGNEYARRRYLSCGTSSDRYCVLNVTNDDTIEVRGFKASWNLRAILASIEMCDALVAFADPPNKGLIKCSHATELVKYVVARATRWPILTGLFRVGRSFITSPMSPEAAANLTTLHILDS